MILSQLVNGFRGRNTAWPVRAMQQNAPQTDHQPEFGSLMAVLFMLIDDQKSVVVHVTATRHGEGTSSIARQLAATAARAPWCKVALIGMHPDDMGSWAGERRSQGALPTLIEEFEQGGQPALHTTTIDGAPVAVAAFSATHGAPRVETIRRLYGWLRASYNLVVLDCPPVLSSRDASVLAGVADGTVLVVEAECTRLTDIQRARSKLEQVGATMLGIALNKRRTYVPALVSRYI